MGPTILCLVVEARCEGCHLVTLCELRPLICLLNHTCQITTKHLQAQHRRGAQIDTINEGVGKGGMGHSPHAKTCLRYTGRQGVKPMGETLCCDWVWRGAEALLLLPAAVKYLAVCRQRGCIHLRVLGVREGPPLRMH